MARVSAIVVTYHTGPRLKECLYALNADPDISETIIVDNGNPPETSAWLNSFCEPRDGFHLITGHGNIGFGAGINLGAQAASGEDILVIIFDIDGSETRGPRRRERTLWRAATSMLGWNTWTLEHTPPPEQAVEMPVISGAFFLISKESFIQLEGFDEAYFLHVEDVDLCRRCREAGGTVMYDPNAAALHYGSTSDVPSRAVANHKADSLALYFKKFSRGPLEKLIVGLAVPVMRFGMRLSGR